MEKFKIPSFCLFIFLAIFFSKTSSAYYPEEKATWIFGGLEAGYVLQQTDIVTEVEKSGFQVGGKLLLSWYWKRFVLDIGAGWYTNKISGESTSITSEIVTETTFYNLIPRIRFGNFQLGPVAEFVYGEDFTYDEILLFNDLADQQTAIFAGLQFLYDFPISEYWRMRIGAKLMGDITVEERQVYAALLDIEIGFPIFKSLKTSSVDEDMDLQPMAPYPDYQPLPDPEPLPPVPVPLPAPIPQPLPPQQPIYQDVPIQVVDDTLKLTLDEAMVPFDTGSSSLKQHSREFLKDLTRYLLEHPNQYQSIIVGGHTDRRGSYNMNLNLSRSRASSVKRFMETFGLPSNRIQSNGYAYDRLIDNGSSQEAHARNRRTEISFGGVRSVKEFRDGLREIIMRHQAIVPGKFRNDSYQSQAPSYQPAPTYQQPAPTYEQSAPTYQQPTPYQQPVGNTYNIQYQNNAPSNIQQAPVQQVPVQQAPAPQQQGQQYTPYNVKVPPLPSETPSQAAPNYDVDLYPGGNNQIQATPYNY